MRQLQPQTAQCTQVLTSQEYIREMEKENEKEKTKKGTGGNERKEPRRKPLKRRVRAGEWENSKDVSC